jgi:putative ABC transport system permease protein
VEFNAATRSPLESNPITTLPNPMNRRTHTQPPTWPLRLMRFFLKKGYIEEIEGDMEEIFNENIEKLGEKNAKRIYIWEMLKLARPILMHNFEGVERLNQYGMFKNYFKVSIRGLMKTPINSAINIIGLAAAIGVCVFGYGFAQWTLATDQFHKNKDVVFLTTFFANREGGQQEYGTTPRPLGEMLKQDFSQIKKVCRVEDRSVIVKHEDKVFNERIRFVDPEFLEMFTFPLQAGTIASLRDQSSVILSDMMAAKYFGEQNPIGQSILVKFDQDHSKAFKVSGVAQPFPAARTIDFNLLINFENLSQADPAYDFRDWTAFVNATFIQVENPADISSIAQGMNKYKAIQNKAATREEWSIEGFGFEPLATLTVRSEYILDDISRSSKNNYRSIYFMVGIAILLLALACFNYINIAIVSAAKRLKEIGVRKSIGATRAVVIVQFLTENIVVTSFALVLGLAFGWTVVIPWFEGLWNFNMGFKINDTNLWIYLSVVLTVTGIASGIYPAFYISRFQAVSILKGSARFGTSNPLTKILLGFQLVLACVFITSAVVFTKNGTYLSHRPWGYNQHDVLYARLSDSRSYEQLSTLMARNPNVISIAGSAQHVGKSHANTFIHLPDRDYEVEALSIDPNYFATLDIPLIAGRNFQDHEGSDRQAVIVNENFSQSMGWNNAVGQRLQIDSVQFEVIGLVKDFHSYSFAKPLRPTIFKAADKSEYRYLTMRVRGGSAIECYNAMQEGWTKLFPETPFTGGFQEDVWGGYYNEIDIYGHVWRVFASMAIILASLGLYGLVSLNVAGRQKEFSIRKVLGAGLMNITGIIASEYVVLFIVAIAIGAPLSYLMIKTLLDWAFPVHVPVSFTIVAVASSILVFVLLATVSTQIRKVAKANPVDGLKVE